MAIQETDTNDANNLAESDEMIESYTSWTKINKQVAIKKLDRSSFFHHGTGVPPELRSFFQIEGLSEGERANIVLNFNGTKYRAYLKLVRSNQRVNPRTQLHYYRDFVSVLRTELPNWYTFFKDKKNKTDAGPMLRFFLSDAEQEYNVIIIDPKKIEAYINSELTENQDLRPRKEGKVLFYYGKRYERSQKNIESAIAFYGYDCAVCGFNFSKVYGDRGKDWIEIHHIKPLSTYEGETGVNPETDLIPVCANCHRMIHRDSKNVLSVDELKWFIKQKKYRFDGGF